MYNFYYTRLVSIHRHSAKAADKPKVSKIARFKQYLENLPYLKLPEEEVASSEGQEQEEGPKDEVAVITTQ